MPISPAFLAQFALPRSSAGPTNGPLLHFDGSGGSTTITDSHGVSTWTTSGSAQLSTAQAKFGPSSLLVNGGYAKTLNMGASLGAQFCVQGWALNTGSTPRGIFHTNLGGSAAGLALGWGGGSNVWEIYHNVAVLTGPGPVPVGWFHWAVWRLAGVIYAAINGHIIASVADTSTLGGFITMNIGQYFNTSNAWQGHIDEVQIDTANPVYSSVDFTPPTNPFT